MTRGNYMEAEQVEAMRATLTQAFGLEGTLAEQYFGFFHRTFLTRDFGPSLSLFPTPVNEVIGRALPWTLGLLLSSTIIAWIVGNAIGLLAGYKQPLALIARAGSHRHLRLPHSLLHHRAHPDYLVHPHQSDFPALLLHPRRSAFPWNSSPASSTTRYCRPLRLSSSASAGGC